MAPIPPQGHHTPPATKCQAAPPALDRRRQPGYNGHVTRYTHHVEKMSEVLVGAVERITYYNEENGYTVAQVTPEGREYTVTVVGALLDISPGESLRLHGQWASHARYGRQFQVERYDTVLPATAAGIEKYLGSGLIKGIGPVTARRIVRRFKLDTLRIIEEDPQRLREVLGVGKKRVGNITRAWEEQKAIKEVMIFLQSHKVSTAHAVKIYKTYGDASIDVVRSDPYRLARDIHGIGFLTADKIARELGLAHDSPQRVQAGIAYTLSQMADDGHVYAPQGELIHESTRILDVPAPLVAEGIDTLAAEEQVRIEYPLPDTRYPADQVLREERAVYLPPFYYGEIGVANRLKTLLHAEKSRLAFYRDADLERVFDHLAEQDGLRLNEVQRAGVRAALTHKVAVLTGGPGTGKTTAMRTVIRLLEAKKYSYALAAPTGRAAKRLAEATGREAKTIHRLLEFKPQKGQQFQRNEENPLDADMVIVDEACLTYRQPVLLADGTWQYIGRIVSERASVEVLSYNFETGELEPKRVTDWFRYPRRSPLLRINASRSNSLRFARIVKATPQHKIATPSGWVKAGDLRVGDKVLVRGHFLSPFQRSFALGSLLGDAHINVRKGVSPHLQFVQGEDQIEYLQFKATVFRHHILSEPTVYPSGYAPHKSVWSVHTWVIDDLVWIYELCYPHGKKTISAEWLSLVDEVGLAAWFLDDGSIQRPKPGKHEALRPRRKPFRSRSPYALLHTEGFSLSEQEMMQRWFAQKWGLHPHIDQDGRGHYFLRFTVSETVKLLGLVRPYTPKCMRGKVGGECDFVPPDEQPPEVAPVAVQSIESWEPATRVDQSSVYDIEVEGNHNYFAGNILVSNSMLDLLLTNHLLKAIHPESHLLLVGDVDQLPSVGAGNVLNDVIESGVAAVVCLSEIFRQAEGSFIIVNAHRINQGQMPLFPKEATDFFLFPAEDAEPAADLVVDLVQNRIPRKFGLDPLADVQVLSPLHRGAAGVGELNRRLQAALNPPRPDRVERQFSGRTFRVGDRVMQTINNYERNTFNGDMGRIVAMDAVNQTVTVRMDGQLVEYDWADAGELVLAYAVSVHKCVAADTIVFTRHGLVCIDSLWQEGNSRFHKAQIPVATHVGWGTTEHVFRGDVEETLTLTTQYGYDLTGSMRHPVLVVDAETKNLIWKKLPEITVGDTVAIARGMDAGPQACLALDPGPDPVGKVTVRLPSTLDESLAEILGFLVAEGSYRDRRDGTIALTSTDPGLMGFYSGLFYGLFGVRLRINQSHPTTRYVVSSQLRTFLERLGLDYVTARQKRIPDLILKSPVSVQAAFLRGLFDGDGGVTQGAVILATGSRELAFQVHLLLLNLGIISRRTPLFIRGGEDTWRVEIRGPAVQVYQQRIGFNSRAKEEKLLAHVEKQRGHKIAKTNVDFVPNGQSLMARLEESIKAAYPQSQGKKGQGFWGVVPFRLAQYIHNVQRGNQRLSFSQLRRIHATLCERLPRPVLDSQVWQDIESVLQAGYFFDRVVDIRAGQCQVYDLCVPEAESFISNGWVSHNSQGSEYPAVVMPVLTQHYVMLSRPILYTGVTRAQKLVVLVGSRKAIAIAVRNNKIMDRHTALDARLRK